MTDDIQKTALRLPRALHTAIINEAKRSVRTMNEEIIYRLQASLYDPHWQGGAPHTLDDIQQLLLNNSREQAALLAQLAALLATD